MKKGLLKTLLVVSFLISSIVSMAQDPLRNPGCTTGDTDNSKWMPDYQAFLARMESLRAGDPENNFTSPYYVRVFIRIVRQDDGTLPGCTEEQALQNFEEMKGQYTAHNICFQLAGIDYVNDTYLNNFNTSANLDQVYPDYIKNNNFDVDGCITIFVHYNFLNNNGSSGNAYGIPNNFLSVARWAATSTNVHSIFGHEMGHCLGLYHTFRRADGVAEAVTRNSGNSCYNCPTEGDLCCDTPADYPNSEDNTSSTTCNYNGTATNSCDGFQYNPSTINIMSYQPWACISFTSTALTANQRSRMHATILNVLGPIYSRVSEDNVALTTFSATSGRRVYGAKNNITTFAGASVSHTTSARAYFVAGNSITFSPGVTLSPSSGLMNASISGCN